MTGLDLKEGGGSNAQGRTGVGILTESPAQLDLDPVDDDAAEPAADIGRCLEDHDPAAVAGAALRAGGERREVVGERSPPDPAPDHLCRWVVVMGGQGVRLIEF